MSTFITCTYFSLIMQSLFFLLDSDIRALKISLYHTLLIPQFSDYMYYTLFFLFIVHTS